MILRSTPNRRRFLAGLGAAAALVPLLDASTSFGQPTAPKRILILQWPNGVCHDYFWPSGTDTNLVFPEITAPLEAHKADVLFLRGLDLRATMDDALGSAGHQSLPHLLTGRVGSETSITGGDPGSRNIGNGISLDQYIANEFAKRPDAPPVHSLVLGVQVGGQRPTHRYVSFRGPAQGNEPDAVPAENDPYAVFRRLFDGFSADPKVNDSLVAERRSVLDHVLGDLNRLQPRIGTSDRVKIESHIQSLRDLELELESLRGATGCAPPTLEQGIDPGHVPSYHQIARMQIDLAIAAMSCDLTRVATLQLSNSHNNDVTFTFLGGGFDKPAQEFGNQTVNHHEIAHKGANGDGEYGALKRQVDRFYVGLFAYAIEKLKSIREGSGTMLDSTIVWCCNNFSNGGAHNVDNMPWILAGNAGGFLRTGRVASFNRVAHNGLLATLATAVGVPTTTFGDPRYDTTDTVRSALEA